MPATPILPTFSSVPAVTVPRAADGVRYSIVVADDNLDAAESLGLWLKLKGHKVTVQHDGRAALESAEQERPAVLLLDIGMPELNGYEVARGVRKKDWGQDMVLIAVTGWDTENDRRQSAAAGFDAHLAKPVDLKALAVLMQELVERKADLKLASG